MAIAVAVECLLEYETATVGFLFGENKFKVHISYSIIKKTLSIKLTISNIK